MWSKSFWLSYQLPSGNMYFCSSCHSLLLHQLSLCLLHQLLFHLLCQLLRLSCQLSFSLLRQLLSLLRLLHQLLSLTCQRLLCWRLSLQRLSSHLLHQLRSFSLLRQVLSVS